MFKRISAAMSSIRKGLTTSEVNLDDLPVHKMISMEIEERVHYRDGLQVHLCFMYFPGSTAAAWLTQEQIEEIQERRDVDSQSESTDSTESVESDLGSVSEDEIINESSSLLLTRQKTQLY